MRPDMAAVLKQYRTIETTISAPGAAEQPQYPEQLKEFGRLSKLATDLLALEAAEKKQAEADELIKDPATDAELKDLAKAELEEARVEHDRLFKQVDEKMYMADPDADRPVLVEIRAGVGGEEACLFARDLFEVYKKYCEKKGWELTVIDQDFSDHDGFRSIDCRVAGEGAYLFFKNEGGGHRVQRVPETEAQGRIHTSAVTVAAMPEYENIDIKIEEKDLEIKVTHAGGPGGQGVNTTDSRVIIKHLPTGIMVNCMETRSQRSNRIRAKQILLNKLFQAAEIKREEETRALRGVQIKSGDRSERIRTYNYSQNRCTDHRLEGDDKNYSLDKILAGELDDLAGALRKMVEAERRAVEPA
ncbi:MAG TPA: PCRF domain-containing protein [Planctomycetota bacterium]|nr:PCRF domain-containing protein [Planctomycetota bacterium]